MNQRWIDDLWFSVENYDTESSNRLGMLARLHDLRRSSGCLRRLSDPIPKEATVPLPGRTGILRLSGGIQMRLSILPRDLWNDLQASALESIEVAASTSRLSARRMGQSSTLRERLIIARRNNDVLVHLPVGSGTPFLGSATTANRVALAFHGFRSTLSRISQWGTSPL
jgi:hypothetical protein